MNAVNVNIFSHRKQEIRFVFLAFTSVICSVAGIVWNVTQVEDPFTWGPTSLGESVFYAE